MKFVVIFEDSPKADPNTRKNHMLEHLRFLESHSGLIEAAGPLRDVARKGRDGLWIVEADGVEDVEQLVRGDPFWPTGLRKSFSILEWTRVFAAGTRLVSPD